MNKERVRLAILKELDNGNNTFKHVDLGIEPNALKDAVGFLQEGGYIDGAEVYFTGNYDISNAMIIKKGENYLEDNYLLMKAYKGLKGARDWIKI
ncbi:YjcQ family protein [Peribacillus sp. NPDC096540]|uniref:YjcQ family protein n=1 Tax=Peribacillus sp. NPDC096540 TaxID=3390612 RepID=UPI003D058F47